MKHVAFHGGPFYSIAPKNKGVGSRLPACGSWLWWGDSGQHL